MTMQVRTVDMSDPGAGAEFTDSLRNTGFAILQNHPIPASLVTEILRQWSGFFAGTDKYGYSYDPASDDGGRAGYFPIEVSETAVGHETRDLKEFFHVLPGGPMPPGFGDRCNAYRELGFSLGARLLDWLQQHSPDSVTDALSVPLSDMLCRETSLLRILHYPPLRGDESPGAVRAAPHEDINLLTLLPVADEPGLQVVDRDGRWIDVYSERNDLIVNSGDMLQEATGRYYPSTRHRVVNPGGPVRNASRLSMPFFLTARREIRLSDRYTAGSYLDERLRLISRA